MAARGYEQHDLSAKNGYGAIFGECTDFILSFPFLQAHINECEWPRRRTFLLLSQREKERESQV
jgi:hypothetical protein